MLRNKTRMKKKIISRLLMLLYVVAVCLLCFLHLGNGFDMASGWLGLPKDKVVHSLMFLPFPVLMYMAFHRQSGKAGSFIMFMILTLIIGAAAGGGIELLQEATGYRSCDIADFRADCIGLFVGSIAVLLYAVLSKKW